MKKNEMITCSSCGVRISKETDKCELCGWPVGQDDHDMQTGNVSIEIPHSATPDEGPFCHMCGWQNPSGARFCSSCGTKLQATKVAPQANLPLETEKKAARTAPSSESAPSEDAALPEVIQPRPLNASHIGMLAVAGLLIVAALYMITVFSQRAFPEVEPTPAQAQSEEAQTGGSELSSALSEDVATRIATLETEAESLSGEALILKKREVVSILSSVNRPDKAAPIQEEIAGLAGTSDDWFNAGHFFYDWMESQRGELRFNIALRATAAYEKGLELNPDDLNIRTALAMAYLNTRAPMQGVQQIRQVLDTDPEHLQGNFYYGVMLMQINRTDQAKTQFERVKELVDPGSPMYQQADRMLQDLNGLN